MKSGLIPERVHPIYFEFTNRPYKNTIKYTYGGPIVVRIYFILEDDKKLSFLLTDNEYGLDGNVATSVGFSAHAQVNAQSSGTKHETK